MKRLSQCAAIAIASATFGMYSASSWSGETFYRWVDERGHTVASDRPPPSGVKYEVISTQSTLVREVDADEGAVPLDVEPSVGNEFDAVETNKSKIEKNPEFCQRARENLRVLDTSVQIQMRNDAGELRNITEEERENQRKRAMDTIAVHCD